MNEKIKNARARELTVREIREVLGGLERRDAIHTVELLFPDGIPALAVSMSSGLSLEELDGDVAPSDLKNLIERVKDANPFFLNALNRLAETGRAMMARMTAPSP